MKNYFVALFCLTICIFSAKSQNFKNSYRIGVHFVNLEDDKFAGDFYYNQYNRKIAKRIEAGIGLGLISYNHIGEKEWLSHNWGGSLPPGVEDAVVFPNYRSNFSYQWLLNTSISYAPIQRKKFKLKIGCGFSATRYVVGSADGGSLSMRYNKVTGEFKYAGYSGDADPLLRSY